MRDIFCGVLQDFGFNGPFLFFVVIFSLSADHRFGSSSSVSIDSRHDISYACSSAFTVFVGLEGQQSRLVRKDVFPLASRFERERERNREKRDAMST